MAAYDTKSVPTEDCNSREFYGLPITYEKASKCYVLDVANHSTDLTQLYEIFADVVEEGQSYPQTSTSLDEFRAYFYGHKTFVVRSKDDDRVAAGFYIKPNFPGRSSHLANYGLLVHKDYRGQGIGSFMVENCIGLARKLGFDALYTNLVYENNTASIAACNRFGFTKVGCVPKAGKLKNLGEVDAFQFYKSLK